MSGDGRQMTDGDQHQQHDDDGGDELVGIVAGVVVAALALLAALIVFCFVCRRRLRKYPDDKAAVAAARLPINFAPGAAGRKPSLNGGGAVVIPSTYGSQHGSPAAALLLPPAGADLYHDHDDHDKMAAVSRDSSYRRPADDLQFLRRQLPDVPPRIPVDSAGRFLSAASIYSHSGS